MKTLLRFKWPIALLVVGLGCEIMAVRSFLGLLQPTGTSWVGPGTKTIRISQPGKYILWHESRTTIDGRSWNVPDALPTGTTIRVTAAATGEDVPLSTNFSTRIESPGSRRISVGGLTLAPGEYEVEVTGLQQQRAFCLEESKHLRILGRALGWGMIGAATLLGGLALGIVTLLRKPRSPE